jgi:hypothetical protein
LEGPPCSRTSWQGWREETSEWDPGGGGDPDVTGSGVETLLGGEEPSLKGEQEHLLSLLSSIVAKRRREKNPKRKSKVMRDGYQRKMNEIFIAIKCLMATVMNVILIPACPLMRVVLKNIHHTLVIQMVKQTIQLFRERYTQM